MADAPKLLDRVRDVVRTRHYSRRTEEAYVGWIRRYILFHRKTHAAQLGAADIAQFLTCLAVERRVSARPEPSFGVGYSRSPSRVTTRSGVGDVSYDLCRVRRLRGGYDGTHEAVVTRGFAGY